MKNTFKLSSVVLVAAFLASQANAALFTRDLDGNMTNGHEAVYDNVLDITWIADADLGDSNTFGVGGVSSTGGMSWATAENWIAAMNAENGGVSVIWGSIAGVSPP